MNLPYPQMERCAAAEQIAAQGIKQLREYGLSDTARIMNELREASESLRRTLIQIAESELENDTGALHTQVDVMRRLESFGLIFRERIYSEFLKKVNSLTLKGGCYDLPLDSAVKEIQCLGDSRVFDYLNGLDVNQKYQRGIISDDLKKILPIEWTARKIWQEISKFTDYKKSTSRGVEFATFFGHPVTPVNYLR